jgi:Protein of unknown function (DUF3829)
MGFYRIGALAVFAAILPLTATAAADMSEKLQPYIECINRISERAYQSQDRYVGWAGRAAAMNAKPKNILGLYEIYDPADCAKGVDKATGAEPRHAELEAAGTGYVEASLALSAILKTANDYYDQGNYKDDKMAKAKEMHPKLLAAFATFDRADNGLRALVEKLNDEMQLAALAEIEKKEGRSVRYLVEAMMVKAKAVVRAKGDSDKVDLPKVTEALAGYEAAVKELEDGAAKDKTAKIGMMVVSNAKSFLVSAKEYMRRLRDKTPYSEGERMIMNQPNAGWMVTGSPARLSRDYNQLIEAYNRH